MTSVRSSYPWKSLNKPGKLTNDEFEMIQTHAAKSLEMLKIHDFEWPAGSHHHGTPRAGSTGRATLIKIKGDDILLEAKILAVADMVVAMTAERPYRPAHSLEAVMAELEKKSGSAYEPKVVEAFQLLINKGFDF